MHKKLSKASHCMTHKQAHTDDEKLRSQFKSAQTNLKWRGSKGVSWGTTEGNSNRIHCALQQQENRNVHQNTVCFIEKR